MYVETECNECKNSYPQKAFKNEKYKFHCLPYGKNLFCHPHKGYPEASKLFAFTEECGCCTYLYRTEVISVSRGIFRSQSNIYDEAFLKK